MSKTWHVYQTLPMDFGWDCLLPFSEYLRRYEAGNSQLLEQFTQACFAVSRQTKWEGDFMQGPYVFFIPDEYEPLIGYVWKQSNNGDCFVACEVKLPHLEEKRDD